MIPRIMEGSYLKTPMGKALLIATLLAALVFVCFFADTLANNTYIPKDGQSVIENYTEGNNAAEDSANQFVRSQAYMSLSHNLTEWNSKDTNLDKGVFCITTENYEYLIYNIDADNIAEEGKTFKDYNYIWVDSGNDNFYAVINISGKNIDLNNYYILVRDETGIYASRAVFNFYEAETIDLTDATVIGTVLAPNAEITCENTSVYGQIQCKKSVGEMEFQKNIRFTGYRKIMDDLNVLSLNNESVKTAAIEYLINNNPDGRFSDYKAGSQVKIRDVSAIKRLNIHASGVTFKDLEADLAKFPNLEELSINGGVLQSLSLKKIKNIKSLSVTGTNIQSVDISAAVNLERLVLDNNKALKNIDFSKNHKIQVLSYSGTPLGWLDYSVLPELYYLDCSFSNIAPNITISGDMLQNVKMLDISGNGEVQTFLINTFPKLEKVNCTRCRILELDFTGMTDLQYFKGSYNRFTEMDFTGAVNLKYIEVYGQDLISIDISGLQTEGVFCTAQIINNSQEEEVELDGTGTE